MEQKRTPDEWMKVPVSEWPANLRSTIDNAGKRWGHSGEVFYECFQAWVKAGSDRALTVDEIIEVLSDNQ